VKVISVSPTMKLTTFFLVDMGNDDLAYPQAARE